METRTKLHKLADEQVDVYEENARFARLLDEYHNGNTKVKDDLWIISYRAACNWLKKRFGHYWTFDQINELALDILSVLFTRIDNRTKYPKGYRPLNLPTTIEGIFLTVYYGNNKRFERNNNISWDGLIESFGDSVYNIVSDTEDEYISEEMYDKEEIIEAD